MLYDIFNPERGTNMPKKTDSTGLKNLKASLKDGAFKQLYLFFGEEDFLKEYYFGELKKSIIADSPPEFNYAVFEGTITDFSAIDAAMESPPWMAERKLILVRGTGVAKSPNAEARAYWEVRLKDLPDYVTLVFYESEADRRGIIYKTAAKLGDAVECAPLEGTELVNWVGRGCRQEGFAIGRSEIDYLIRSCDGGMNNIKRELEKLFHYCIGSITKADIDRIVTKLPQARVFEMLNAMLRGDGRAVFAQLGELVTLKESPFMVLALLCTNFERIYHAKVLLEEGTPPNAIASAIGVSPYFVRDYTGAAAKFTKPFLRRALCEIAEIDLAVKQGEVDAWLAVEQFLARCMAA